jgi:hypothetical protein
MERPMIADAVACYLYEPDGTLVVSGLFSAPSGRAGEALLTMLDRPGRLVQRCLLGPVRSVWLHLADGTLLGAHVERVFFDPTAGRSAHLRLVSVAAPAG